MTAREPKHGVTGIRADSDDLIRKAERLTAREPSTASPEPSLWQIQRDDVGDWNTFTFDKAVADKNRQAGLRVIEYVRAQSIPVQPSTASKMEASSRGMFVARLQNDPEALISGNDVLALLSDCDMLASRENEE